MKSYERRIAHLEAQIVALRQIIGDIQRVVCRIMGEVNERSSQ